MNYTKMIFLRISSIILFAILISYSLHAQSLDIKTGDKEDDKMKVTMGGRMYLDGAYYIDDKTPIGSGATASDIRLSLKAVYKKWDFKIDIGFNDRKINTKDFHIRYNFDSESWLKFGHYGPQYGNEAWESSAWQRFIAPATSDQILGLGGRKLGVTYVKWNDKFYLSGGLFFDSDAITNAKEGDQGYMLVADVNYTPINEDGTVFHFGPSAFYRIGDRNGFNLDGKTNRYLSYSSNLNSKISKQKSVGFTVDSVKYQTSGLFEIIASSGPAFFQSEFYYSHIKRDYNLSSYNASGFYVMGGVLLFGEKKYSFDLKERKLGHPTTKSLELVVRYNYVDLNDKNINGGIMSDISVGFNYYLNKYMGIKLSYSYMAMGNHNLLSPTGEKENVQVIQGRLLATF